MRKTAKIIHVIELDDRDTAILEAIFSDWSEACTYRTPDNYDAKDTLLAQFNKLLGEPLSEVEKSRAHDAVERS